MRDLDCLTTGAEFEVFGTGFFPGWSNFPCLGSSAGVILLRRCLGCQFQPSSVLRTGSREEDGGWMAAGWRHVVESKWFNAKWEPAVCTGKYGKNGKFWGRKRGKGKEKSTFSPQQKWKSWPKSAKLRSWSWPDHFYKVSAQSELIWPISLNISLCFQLLDPPRSQFLNIFQQNHNFLKELGPGTLKKWKISKFCIQITAQQLRRS